LCEYSIHSKTCDAKGNFGCPDGTVCNISSKPGICVSYDSAENFLESKETSTLKYKGHNIIGSKSAIEALKKQLEKIKPAAKPITKPVAKITPKKGPKYRTDPLTKKQLITVISSITGRSPDYYKTQDILFLTKLYEKISTDYQKAMELAIQLSELTGMPVDTFDSWDIEEMEFEIDKYQNQEEVHVDEEEEKEEDEEEKEESEAESEVESVKEEKISRPKTASLAGIKPLTQKMKAMVVQDEDEEYEEEKKEATPPPKPAAVKPVAKEKPKPKEKPKEKPKPKPKSASESKSAEDSDEEKNEVSAKVQKIIKNIKAGKKADDGTEISQWQQAVIKCLGLGA
jgi:hypothetical protein